jgi:hypothetical protein
MQTVDILAIMILGIFIFFLIDRKMGWGITKKLSF